MIGLILSSLAMILHHSVSCTMDTGAVILAERQKLHAYAFRAGAFHSEDIIGDAQACGRRTFVKETTLKMTSLTSLESKILWPMRQISEQSKRSQKRGTLQADGHTDFEQP